MNSRLRWDYESIQALGVTTDVATASSVLGVGRSTAYDLIRQGRFPVPVVKAGGRYRVPVAPLLEILGLPTGGGSDVA